jgi:hypothetical protein
MYVLESTSNIVFRPNQVLDDERDIAATMFHPAVACRPDLSGGAHFAPTGQDLKSRVFEAPEVSGTLGAMSSRRLLTCFSTMHPLVGI